MASDSCRTIKADLHFHPSFSSPGKSQLTEWTQPSLAHILKEADFKGIDLLAVTSCSSPGHIDKRWDSIIRDSGCRASNPFDSSIEDCTTNSESQPQILFFSFAGSENSEMPGSYLHGGEKRTTIIFHGQEFKTDALDVNVIFAEKRVPMSESSRVSGKCDFDYTLEAARDSGNNVVIALQPVPLGLSSLDTGCPVAEKELARLYGCGKFDCFESYDAMALGFANRKAKEISDALRIPGIAVSDGHRLADMGRAHIKFGYSASKTSEILNPAEMLASRIKSGVFGRFEKPLSFLSRGLYAARLTEAIIRNKLKRKG